MPAGTPARRNPPGWVADDEPKFNIYRASGCAIIKAFNQQQEDGTWV